MKIEYQLTFSDYRDACGASAIPLRTVRRILIALLLIASMGSVIESLVSPAKGLINTDTFALGDVQARWLKFAPFAPWIFLTLMSAIVGRPSAKMPRRFDNVSGVKSRYWRWNVYFFVFALATVSTTFDLCRRFGWGLASPTALCIFFMPIFWYMLFFWRLRKNVAQVAESAGFQTLVYSAESINASDDLSSSTFRWEKLVRCAETEKLFLLFLAPESFVIVPKRAFPSPQAIDSFRMLIQDWVDGRNVGFPVVTPCQTSTVHQ